MSADTSAAASVTPDGKIICHIDGAAVHSVALHIKNSHPDWTIERYRETYPEAPTLSDYAIQKMEEKRKAALEASAAAAVVDQGRAKKAFHEVFGISPKVKAAMSAAGEPIMIDVLTDRTPEQAALIPEKDPNYVWDIDLAKTAVIGLALNMPMYFWGYHGTGKTTTFEQVAAATRRPFLRVQHTVNTEEAHIVGQYVVKDGATVFQPGPLTEAMIEGYVYCADEYDFAMPSVLSVYQPVLEGKPLVIKDAPPEFRIVRPHRDFRFVATGNTNGGGDETGLYQGTQMQNAANYSRFGIVEEVQYMNPKTEAAVIAGQSGIDIADATKLVSFAKEVRDAFKGGKIGATVSPRELIGAAKLGLVRGGKWRSGLRQGYLNRLSRVDREVVDQYAQRIFGEA